jgi:hypothetical protein
MRARCPSRTASSPHVRPSSAWLRGKRRMTVGQITEAALPLTALKGKTPKQTFYSVLYGEAKKTDGLVVKAGDGGVFKLNPKRRKAAKS